MRATTLMMAMVVACAVMGASACFPGPKAVDEDATEPTDTSEATDTAAPPDTAEPTDSGAPTDSAAPTDTAADTSDDTGAGCTMPCDDGDPCTVDDACSAGVCQGAPMVCSPGPCQVNGRCEAGACVYDERGDGQTCDDGDACTLVDKCQRGACVGTGEPDDRQGDWVVPISGVGYEAVNDIAVVDHTTHVLITTTSETTSIGENADGVSVVTELPPDAASALVAARYDLDGRALDARVLASSTDDISSDLAFSVLPDGATLFAARWTGTLTVGERDEVAAPGGSVAVVRMSATSTVAWLLRSSEFTSSVNLAPGRLHLAVAPGGASTLSVTIDGPNGDFLGFRGPVSSGGSIPTGGEATGGIVELAPSGAIRWVAAIGQLNPLADAVFGFARLARAPTGVIVGGIAYGALSIGGGDTSIVLDLTADAEDSTVAFAKLSPEGVPVWGRGFAGTRESYITAMRPCGDRAVTGLLHAGDGRVVRETGATVESGVLAGPTIVFANEDGTFEQLARVSTTQDFTFADVRCTSDAVYAMGFLDQLAIFEAGPPPIVVTAASGADSHTSYLARYDLDGTLRFASTFGGEDAVPQPEGTHLGVIAPHPNGGTLIATRYRGHADFGTPNGRTAQLTSASNDWDVVLLHVNSRGGLTCD